MNLIVKKKDEIIFEKDVSSLESTPFYANFIQSLNEVAEKYFYSKLVYFEINKKYVNYYKSESGVEIIHISDKEGKVDFTDIYKDYCEAVLYDDMSIFVKKYKE